MDYVQSTVSRISGFGATDTAPMPRDLEELPELSRRFGGRNGLITLNPKAPVNIAGLFGTAGLHGRELRCGKNST
jgi:hypothetical protein